MNCKCGGAPVAKHWRSNWKVRCSNRESGCRMEGHTMGTKRDAMKQWDEVQCANVRSKARQIVRTLEKQEPSSAKCPIANPAWRNRCL